MNGRSRNSDNPFRIPRDGQVFVGFSSVCPGADPPPSMTVDWHVANSAERPVPSACASRSGSSGSPMTLIHINTFVRQSGCIIRYYKLPDTGFGESYQVGNLPNRPSHRFEFPRDFPSWVWARCIKDIFFGTFF